MKMGRNGIEARDIKRLLLKVYKELRSGTVSESRAYREAFILNAILKAIEVSDMEERLMKIEGMMTHE
ncbi:MAG: hypothetical protein BWY86_00028 [Candidatus Aminicenantes bacterium ADurb.Bin508]|nr:MAG: hypothetical protein BWY86_00028 [Candidatus Aminicenantes bacterium ADurb.Bin508]